MSVGESTPFTREHFSHSRIQRYLTCPEQYRLYYIEDLRPKVESASLVFGAVLHAALARYFRFKDDPVQAFTEELCGLKQIEVRYSRKETWESLGAKGERLLDKFVREEAHKITRVFLIEHAFELGLSTLDHPFVGVIDLVAEFEGKRTLVEFKTAASDFEPFEIALLDQMTAYHLAVPDVEQAAFCVFLKTKKPRIVWHVTKRTSEQVVEYAEKAETIASEIRNRIFYKRFGKWCRQCDFLPLCLGNERQARAQLVSLSKLAGEEAPNAESGPNQNHPTR